MKTILSISTMLLLLFCCSCNQKVNEPKITTKDVDTVMRQLDTLAILLNTSSVNKPDTTTQAYKMNANVMGAFLAPSALERDGDAACTPKKHGSIIATPIIGDGDYMITNWAMCMYEQRSKETLFDQLLDCPPTCLAMGIVIALIIVGGGLLIDRGLNWITPILFPITKTNTKAE